MRTGEAEVDARRRVETISHVIHNTTVVVVAAVAIVTILPEFGINAGPLIAGLGLVGLAVGFGAQNLVRDVINGVEILLENQYGRGDFVRVRSTTGGTYAGVVEDINLRRTVLRDVDGAVYFISHGHIEAASNLTRGATAFNFTVAVDPKADLERVAQVIDRVGHELAVDTGYSARVRRAPSASGVEALGESSVALRVEGESAPGEQGRVANEMRRRLKQAFDAEGIALKG
jgi:small conductance mechanosensitive channel